MGMTTGVVDSLEGGGGCGAAAQSKECLTSRNRSPNCSGPSSCSRQLRCASAASICPIRAKHMPASSKQARGCVQGSGAPQPNSARWVGTQCLLLMTMRTAMLTPSLGVRTHVRSGPSGLLLTLLLHMSGENPNLFPLLIFTWPVKLW